MVFCDRASRLNLVGDDWPALRTITTAYVPQDLARPAATEYNPSMFMVTRYKMDVGLLRC